MVSWTRLCRIDKSKHHSVRERSRRIAADEQPLDEARAPGDRCPSRIRPSNSLIPAESMNVTAERFRWRPLDGACRAWRVGLSSSTQGPRSLPSSLRVGIEQDRAVVNSCDLQHGRLPYEHPPSTTNTLSGNCTTGARTVAPGIGLSETLDK